MTYELFGDVEFAQTQSRHVNKLRSSGRVECVFSCVNAHGFSSGGIFILLADYLFIYLFSRALQLSSTQPYFWHEIILNYVYTKVGH